MTTTIYEFAGIPVAVTALSGAIEALCHDYRSEREPAFSIVLTAEDIAAERAAADRPGYSDGYLETLALYRKFCDVAAGAGVILFHSSAIAVDGRAYLFAAPSGTGKSTHTRLWRELLGDRVVTVNDDKPLIALRDGVATVYGTPWDGKHRMSTKTSAPIAGICFLSRGAENRIQRISVEEGTKPFLEQTYRPRELSAVAAMLGVAAGILSRVPLYTLQCNISTDAARLSYETMRG